MGLREGECTVTDSGLDAVIEQCAGTTGVRDVEQVAEHIESITFDGDMVRKLFE